MDRIVIRAARAKWVAFLVGATSFVAAGLLLVITRAAIAIGWLNVLIFGGAAVVFARNVFDARPRITFDERGILDRTLRVGLIEWTDIEDVYLKHSQGQPFLCLKLRDASKYTARLSPILRRLVVLNRSLGFTDLSLNLIGADVDPMHVEELVRKELAVRSNRSSRGHR
jgi:hypothetical protein